MCIYMHLYTHIYTYTNIYVNTHIYIHELQDGCVLIDLRALVFFCHPAATYCNKATHCNKPLGRLKSHDRRVRDIQRPRGVWKCWQCLLCKDTPTHTKKPHPNKKKRVSSARRMKVLTVSAVQRHTHTHTHKNHTRIKRKGWVQRGVQGCWKCLLCKDNQKKKYHTQKENTRKSKEEASAGYTGVLEVSSVWRHEIKRKKAKEKRNTRTERGEKDKYIQQKEEKHIQRRKRKNWALARRTRVLTVKRRTHKKRELNCRSLLQKSPINETIFCKLKAYESIDSEKTHPQEKGKQWAPARPTGVLWGGFNQ